MKTTPVKLDIGDIAFFIWDNSVRSGRVDRIEIDGEDPQGGTFRFYRVNGYTRPEHLVFASKAELLASL